MDKLCFEGLSSYTGDLKTIWEFNFSWDTTFSSNTTYVVVLYQKMYGEKSVIGAEQETVKQWDYERESGKNPNNPDYYVDFQDERTDEDLYVTLMSDTYKDGLY